MMQPHEFQQAQADFTNLCVTVANFPLRQFIRSLERAKEYRQQVPPEVIKKAERNMEVMKQLAMDLLPIQNTVQIQIQKAQKEGI